MLPSTSKSGTVSSCIDTHADAVMAIIEEERTLATTEALGKVHNLTIELKSVKAELDALRSEGDFKKIAAAKEIERLQNVGLAINRERERLLKVNEEAISRQRESDRALQGYRKLLLTQGRFYGCGIPLSEENRQDDIGARTGGGPGINDLRQKDMSTDHHTLVDGHSITELCRDENGAIIQELIDITKHIPEAEAFKFVAVWWRKQFFQQKRVNVQLCSQIDTERRQLPSMSEHNAYSEGLFYRKLFHHQLTMHQVQRIIQLDNRRNVNCNPSFGVLSATIARFDYETSFTLFNKLIFLKNEWCLTWIVF